MIRIRRMPQHALASRAGDAQAMGAIDPLVSAGLVTAGQILSRTDAGAPRTMELIQAHAEVPPLFAPSGLSRPSKLSDLNGTLETLLFIRQHPVAIALGALAIPLLAFALGKQAGARAVTRGGR